MRLRKVLLTAHLCAGIVVSPFLLVLGLTGAALVFEDQIVDVFNGSLTRVQASGVALGLGELRHRLEQANPGYRVTGVGFPADPAHSMTLELEHPDSAHAPLAIFVNPYDGRVLGHEEDARDPMGWVHQLHTHLLAGPIGAAVLGWMAVVLAFMALSGLVLWWPGKIFRLKSSGSRRRLVLDLHNVQGAYSWVFLLGFAASGAVVHWDQEVGDWIDRRLGAQPAAARPQAAPACAGKAGWSAESLLAVAESQAPGARPTMLKASLRSEDPVRIALKFPEDRTPAGRTNIFLESCSGRVIQATISRMAPLGFRYAKMWNREIHTGDLFGWPSRILAALFSLTLPLLGITGPLLWWNRRKARARVPAPNASGQAIRGV